MKYYCQVPGHTYSCPDTGRECVGLEVEADSIDEARAKALEAYGITGGISLGKVICQLVAEKKPEKAPKRPVSLAPAPVDLE